MWMIFEIGVNLFEAVFMLAFLKSRLHLRKHSISGELACVGITMIPMAINLFYPDFISFYIPDPVYGGTIEKPDGMLQGLQTADSFANRALETISKRRMERGMSPSGRCGSSAATTQQIAAALADLRVASR